MLKRVLCSVFLCFLAGGAASGQARPVCPYGPAPCEAYEQADAVFVGTVTRTVPASIRREWTDADYDQTATVAIKKVYKGYESRSIVLRQLGRRNAQKFIQGASYLFYANYDRAARVWEVRPCGRTVMSEYAHLDLRYVEGLRGLSGRTRVSGRVARFDNVPDAEMAAPEGLADIRVRLAAGAREYEARTDERGIFEFLDLPPGRYRVEARVPNGLVFFGALHTGPDPFGRSRTMELELAERGCAEVVLLYTEDKPLKQEGGRQVGRAAPQASTSFDTRQFFAPWPWRWPQTLHWVGGSVLSTTCSTGLSVRR